MKTTGHSELPIWNAMEGNPRFARLYEFFRAHPILAAILIWILDLIFLNGLIVALQRFAPTLPAEFVALFPGSILLAIVLTVLGWWRVTGFNRPAEWRELGLLVLPAIIIIVPPLVLGVKPIEPGTLAFLSLGYLLTGFREETLYRGILLRVLLPKGTMRAALISSVLFGLAHFSNLLVRSNPAIVAAQALGAFCDGFGFAALRIRTNTIWFLILLHAIHDLLLQLTNLPAIPLDVAQVTLLLLYGIYLLRKHKDLDVQMGLPNIASAAVRK
jgi:membrane protease YdiL (CAAX protease family)